MRSPLLLALAAAVAAADPTVINAAKTISVSDTPAGVAVVRFWQSADGGKSWSLAHQASVPAEAQTLPTWSFAPTRDGDYLLLTSITRRDGSAEADPKPGEVPSRALAIVYDATAPVIASFTASLVAGDPASPTATIQSAWSASDAHLAATDVEISQDGTTWTQAQTGGATGSASLTVPRDGRTVNLRLTAHDAAGSRTVSALVSVAVPTALKPEEVLAKAVEALPELAAVAPPAPAPADPAPVAAAPTTETPAVVIPEGSPLAGAPLLKESTPTLPPGATAEAPSQSGPAPVVPPSRTEPRPVELPAGRYLDGAAAEAALQEAAATESLDAALPRYLRLVNSSVAEAARDELLTRLEADNDPATTIAVFDALPIELRDARTRVRAGQAYLRLQRFADAEAVVAKVGKASGHLRPALLVMAKAALGRQQQARATKLLEHLAGGDDAVAAEAKLLRGK